MIALVIYLLLSILYLLFIAWTLRGLQQLHRQQFDGNLLRTSVVIAARNEEQNIPFCLGTLLKQSCPRELLEIVVVDDQSGDGTRAVVERIAAKYPTIRILGAPAMDGLYAPKKAALAAGIAAASGEIILTLDADCSAPPHWVKKMCAAFSREAAAVAAWVLIPEEKSLAARIEFLDALALQLVGAAAIGWNRPLLANGANLAFRRRLFLDNGGYDGFAQMGSGDDDLLVQKLGRLGAIHFNADPEAGVTTFPCSSWGDFFRQRIRWASKSACYPVWIKAVEAGLFFCYLALLLGLPLALLFSFPLWIPLAALLIKTMGDAFLIHRGVHMVHRSWDWGAFILASLLHLIYIPVVGLLGLCGRFTWKGRRYRQGRLSGVEQTKR
ncbi:MAG TPA: glycosyltransferase [bacterium]|nr:glycosyltransferase [bacterium]HQG45813.1 glycosyltransferase [bacterium]HQI47768.1 glycosyltransferase [bacterium]HQJ63198.1 glycosyltransferase [bacterium]